MVSYNKNQIPILMKWTQGDRLKIATKKYTCLIKQLVQIVTQHNSTLMKLIPRVNQKNHVAISQYSQNQNFKPVLIPQHTFIEARQQAEHTKTLKPH